MSRVYIHEVVEVDGPRRAEYQHHMTANWVPEASGLRRQRCFGVFTLVGSTGPWPRVVNLWEYETWDDLAHNFSVELTGTGHRDPMLERWWREAAEFRRGGHDRILVSHSAGQGVEYWQARGGCSAVGYAHELLRTTPGEAPALAERIAQRGAAAMGESGLGLVGLWRTAMRVDDEVVALWSLPDWTAWASLEEAQASGGGLQDDAIIGRQRWLLMDAELSPLRTGRQPAESDRRAIDSV